MLNPSSEAIEMASMGLSKSRKSSKGFSSHSSNTNAPQKTWSRLSAVVEGHGTIVAPVKLTVDSVEPLQGSSLQSGGQEQQQEQQHDCWQPAGNLSQEAEEHDEGSEGAGVTDRRQRANGDSMVPH